jgi:hypothetical protein
MNKLDFTKIVIGNIEEYDNALFELTGKRIKLSFLAGYYDKRKIFLVGRQIGIDYIDLKYIANIISHETLHKIIESMGIWGLDQHLIHFKRYKPNLLTYGGL